MSKKFNVETVGAVIDRNPIGSTIELSEKEAKYFESIGYVRIIEEIKAKPKPAKKAKSAPKKPAKTSTKKKNDK